NDRHAGHDQAPSASRHKFGGYVLRGVTSIMLRQSLVLGKRPGSAPWVIRIMRCADPADHQFADASAGAGRETGSTFRRRERRFRPPELSAREYLKIGQDRP